MNHAIFLTGLIAALIVFPKYISDLYVFLISVRIEFSPSPTCSLCHYLPFNLPGDRFPAGRICRMGTTPTKLDIRNFARLSPESRVEGLARPFCSLPPIDSTSPLDLLTSREYRLVSLALNSISFVSSCLLPHSINQRMK